LGFSNIKIYSHDNEWVFGKAEERTQAVKREIKVPTGRAKEYSTIKLIAQYPKIDDLVVQKHNRILFPVIIGLVLFGVFLIWAIRTMVHRPLEKIVNATQAISDGVTDLRLDTDRQDEFGYIARFFNAMLDQLMEQQEQLKFAVREAKNANNAKSSFLANMSHELRTPLNAIIGYADLLVEQANEFQQSECVPDLHKIRTAGAYLLDLINNILDISKIEAGKTEIYYQSVNIEAMINDIQSTMVPLVKKNNNELLVDIEENLGEIKTDYTKLRQSVFNLMSNACKFTENGKITLRVYRYTYNIKEKLIVDVEDTGTGMSNECLSDLFAPFARGKNSTALKISGTGLGLAISRQFCNLLGGDISVDSILGVGTVFKIHLPYIKADEEGDSIPVASTGSN
jgi:signal transduction histidine kinase